MKLYKVCESNIKKELEQFFDLTVEVSNRLINDNFETFTVKILSEKASQLDKYCKKNQISYKFSDKLIINKKINIEDLNNLCKEIKKIYNADEVEMAGRDSELIISWWTLPF